MARIRKNYGLPKLSFEEAARVLNIRVGELKLWVIERMHPSPSEWSRWEHNKRDLPEETIRLYLSTEGGNAWRRTTLAEPAPPSEKGPPGGGQPRAIPQRRGGVAR